MHRPYRTWGPIDIPILSISDPADPRLAPYVSIREKDLTRGHGGRFIVEGKVTLAALIRRSRFAPESLFLAENRLEPLAELLAELPDSVPVYTAPREIMDQVVGFPIHRGVLACAQKAPPLDLANLLAGAKTVLTLIGLSNHDNTGACFRNGAAFGTDAILLDAESCDPLYRKSIRVSAGTTLTLPFVHGETPEQIFDALAAAGFTIWCLTPRANAPAISDMVRPDKLALVLGAEGPGLPDALLARGQPVRIPMTDGFDSINVATAGAIALSSVFQR
ncbi:MAG: RNA methyltransferase [Hyphomonadaceae bacterium]